MNVLEKILEEIDKKADYYESDEQGREHIRMVDMVEVDEIIRSHMDEVNNSGWIPVSERLPDSNDYILLSFSNFSLPMVGRFEDEAFILAMMMRGIHV